MLYAESGGKRWAVDQSVHGHDWYQVTYDAPGGSFSVTFTLPLARLSLNGAPVRLTLETGG